MEEPNIDFKKYLKQSNYSDSMKEADKLLPKMLLNIHKWFQVSDFKVVQAFKTKQFSEQLKDFSKLGDSNKTLDWKEEKDKYYVRLIY